MCSRRRRSKSPCFLLRFFVVFHVPFFYFLLWRFWRCLLWVLVRAASPLPPLPPGVVSCCYPGANVVPPLGQALAMSPREICHSYTTFNTCYNDTGLFGIYAIAPRKPSIHPRAPTKSHRHELGKPQQLI